MLNFEEERRGYDKNQVKEYIETLEEEYKKLLTEIEEKKTENKGLQEKVENSGQQVKRYKQMKEKAEEERDSLLAANKKLLERVKLLELSDKPSYSEAIASALVSAEMSAKQIIENAEKRAQLINEDATRDLSDIIKVKTSVLNEIRRLDERLTEVLKQEAEMKERTSELVLFEGAYQDE